MTPAKAATAASEAQLALNRYLYDNAVKLSKQVAISFMEVEQKKRDFIAAEEDVRSKKDLEKKCPESLPTLKQLKDLED